MLSNADIAQIKRIRDRSTVSLNMAAAKLRLLKDCVALSSGTMASLTGSRSYEILDGIHGDFAVFVEVLLPRRNWVNWMDAWREFWGVYGKICT